MRSRKTTNLAGDEQGFASIVIALVLIVILALITVGFAQLARREQKDALDKQLSTQAYYAAESGINDAAKDIHTGAIYDHTHDTPPGATDASATTCMTRVGSGSGTQSLPIAPVPGIPAALTATPSVNSANNVLYSCLLVDLSPSSLVFTDTPPGAGQYLAFSTTAALSTLTVQWGSYDGHQHYPTSGTYAADQKFPASVPWNNADYLPVLQFSLSPTNSGGAISRGGLIDNTFNAYLYPASDHSGYTSGIPNNSTQLTEDLTKQGQIVPGNCGSSGSSTYPCSVTITSGLGGLGGTTYVMHYLDYYDAANVYITGTDSSGNPVDFIGQVKVDVTGKAHNVLRRLQVRLNASGTNGTIGTSPLLPDDSVQSQNICKRLATRPGNTDFISPSGSTVNSGPDPCNLEN
jgi:type II secretory pathway pseudopilin PulG